MYMRLMILQLHGNAAAFSFLFIDVEEVRKEKSRIKYGSRNILFFRISLNVAVYIMWK